MNEIVFYGVKVWIIMQWKFLKLEMHELDIKGLKLGSKISKIIYNYLSIIWMKHMTVGCK